MKTRIERDQKRRVWVEKYEEKRKKLKKEMYESPTMMERMSKVTELALLPRRSSPSRIHNRCSWTGRSRGVYRQWKISRILFREKALFGLIPGLRKSSW
jgi:small subunit ribosomal protein S14